LKLANRGHRLGVGRPDVSGEPALAIGYLGLGGAQLGAGQVNATLALAAQFQRQRKTDARFALARRAGQPARRLLEVKGWIRPERRLLKSGASPLYLETNGRKLSI
jgi:hypothetical protein